MSVWDAVEKGQWSKVKSLLEEFPEQLKERQFGKTLLEAACCAGRHELVECLFSEDNLTGKEAFCVLESGCSKTMKALFDIKPELFLAKQEGDTALQHCLWKALDAHLPLAYLSQSGLPARKKIMFSLLYHSKLFRKENDILRLIKRKRLLPLLKNDDQLLKMKFEGKTLFFLACEAPDLNVMKYISEKDPSQVNETFEYWTPFLAAAKSGFQEMLFVYTKAPAQLHALYKGVTPFMLLCSENVDINVLEFILQKDPGQIDRVCRGITPLEVVVQSDNQAVKDFVVTKLDARKLKCPVCRAETKHHRIFSEFSGECPVCLIAFNDNAYSTLCGHLLCGSCLSMLPQLK